MSEIWRLIVIAIKGAAFAAGLAGLVWASFIMLADTYYLALLIRQIL